mmetsp:Transcript_45089/g.143645  ORF Transcript_45089/g.143645 Transcript_45089/m.143645 type:complete len:205 (-) Transcript_45089:297-911(-)
MTCHLVRPPRSRSRVAPAFGMASWAMRSRRSRLGVARPRHGHAALHPWAHRCRLPTAQQLGRASLKHCAVAGPRRQKRTARRVVEAQMLRNEPQPWPKRPRRPAGACAQRRPSLCPARRCCHPSHCWRSRWCRPCSLWIPTSRSCRCRSCPYRCPMACSSWAPCHCQTGLRPCRCYPRGRSARSPDPRASSAPIPARPHHPHAA